MTLAGAGLLAAYVVLEIASMLILHEPFAWGVLKRLLDAVLFSIKEVRTGAARERLCGVALMLCIVIAVVFIIYMVTAALTQEHPIAEMALAGGIAIFCILFTLALHKANRYFIVQR